MRFPQKNARALTSSPTAPTTSIALQLSRNNVADHLTDFLQEAKDRAQPLLAIRPLPQQQSH